MTTSIRNLLVLVLLAAGPLIWNPPVTGEPRVWTDSTETYRLQATFVELDGATVVLERSDGTRIRVPLNRLSRPTSAWRKPSQKARRSRAGQTRSNRTRTARERVPVEVSAVVFREEPQEVIVFPDIARQRPLYVILRLKGQPIADAVEYGRFTFSIKDDQGKALKLLTPVKGTFNENLQQDMARLDHFFLDQANQIKLPLIVQRPAPEATSLSIDGSFQLMTRSAITVPNVMSNLGKPLSDPRLAAVGKITVSLPRAGESDIEGSLAVDFAGDRTRIDDIEFLDGDGIKLSTGGTGMGSRQQARYIRWAGEKLPKDTQLRIC